MVGNEKKENDVQTSALKAEAPVTLQDLEAVFQRHNRLVFRSAYRVTGNHSDAEDVMQTVFLRLLRREGSLELGSNPEGYLHRAAVNAALDLLRSRKSARSISLEDTSAQATQDFSPGPEARHAATEIREWLRDAVGRLNNTAAEMPVGLSLQQMERKLIEATLQHFDSHRAKTARALGIGVRTLANKLRSYGYAPRTKVFAKAA